MHRQVLYYTTNKLDETLINKLARDYIRKSGLPIVSVSQKPLKMGKNVVFRLNGRRGRSHLMLYNQILEGLKASTPGYIFFCEHDVLYHPSHFEFKPQRNDIYYYNNNTYKFRLSDKKLITYDAGWLSQLCADRDLLINHYIKRIKMIENGERAYGYEPGSGQSKRIDNVPKTYWESQYPNIDIRHGDNWTGVNRMHPSEFKNKNNCQNFKEIELDDLPGWEKELILSL